MAFIGKWQAKFFIELVITWLSIKGRHTFENLSRQGELSSESYRSNFSNSFDFKTFNRHLFAYIGLEKVWAFNPSFLSKSGTETYAVCKERFEVISRMRNDAVMFYPYLSPQRKGRGRKKKFVGKVNVKNLDESQFIACIKSDRRSGK